MCKIGDIILVKKYKSDNKEIAPSTNDASPEVRRYIA